MPIPLIFSKGEGEQGSKHDTIHKEGPGEESWILALTPANIEGFFLMWNSVIRKPEMPIRYNVVPKAFY